MNELTFADFFRMILRPGVILSLVGAGFAGWHVRRTRWAWLLLGGFVGLAVLSVADPLLEGLTILGVTPQLSALISAFGVIGWIAYAGIVVGVVGLLKQVNAASRQSPSP